jgi:subtilisin family serine protease
MRRTTARPSGPSRTPHRTAWVASGLTAATLGLGLLASGVAGPALAGTALATENPSTGHGTPFDARSGVAAEPIAPATPQAAVVQRATAEAATVAVALVEKPDGSLSVETHDTASASAAQVLAGQPAQQDDVVAAGVDRPVYAAANDELFGCQWAMVTGPVDCGSTFSPADVDPAHSLDVDAEVWPKSTGAGVTVAVLDSGVDGSHPDLRMTCSPATTSSGASAMAGSTRSAMARTWPASSPRKPIRSEPPGSRRPPRSSRSG